MSLAEPPVRAQINGDKTAVFDFWATWCGPCRVISPVFEKISDQYADVAFYKVDVDQLPDISQEVGIRAVRGARLVEMVPEG
jgi:thioredoxin 1